MAVRRTVILIVIVAGLLLQCGCRRGVAEPTSPVAVDEWASFASPYFGFPYPANWKAIDEGEIQSRLEKNITPLLADDGAAVLWAGGVAGCSGPGRCSNRAIIFAVVMRVPGFPGPMSDQEFSQLADILESTYRQSLGTKVRAVDRPSVSSFRAVALTALSPSGGEVVRIITIWAKTDHAYVVYCAASERSFDSYADVFENAIRQMEVKTS